VLNDLVVGFVLKIRTVTSIVAYFVTCASLAEIPFLNVIPASFNTSPRFSRACLVSALIPPETRLFDFGQTPTEPLRYKVLSTRTPLLKV
jgi:hypothetical protein